MQQCIGQRSRDRSSCYQQCMLMLVDSIAQWRGPGMLTTATRFKQNIISDHIRSLLIVSPVISWSLSHPINSPSLIDCCPIQSFGFTLSNNFQWPSIYPNNKRGRFLGSTLVPQVQSKRLHLQATNICRLKDVRCFLVGVSFDKTQSRQTDTVW